MAKPKSKPKKRTTKAHTVTQRKLKAKKGDGFKFWRFLLKLLLAGLVLLAILMAYLDAQVRAKFEGKRWSLPAKVYARALDLYPGKPLEIEDLRYELELLGYRSQQALSRPGSFWQSANQLQFFSRGFKLWNETVPSRRVIVTFNSHQIVGLQSEDDQHLSLVSVEPFLMGGIYPAHGEDRSLVRIEQVPKFVQAALLAVEDKDFYSHHGVSLKAISRALWANVRAGRYQQGGSTLTQQLVKNFYLTSDRTLIRKATEALMAVLLDLHYEKQEILEAYLNEVYLGQAGQRAIHGFGLASQYYFGREINELKLHQAALLVSLVKGPSYYNPRRHPERALARRDLVLSILEKEGVATAEQINWAKRQPLDVIDKSAYTQVNYPAYMDLVKRQLRRDYRGEDLVSEGLRIFTSLDPVVQRHAEASLVKRVNQFRRQDVSRMRSLEGAVVVTSTDTAEVLALVGGQDTRYSGFNRALDAARPVGSLLKPAVYLAALENPQQYTLVTKISDESVAIPDAQGKVWSPKNYDKKSHGMVPLHRALAQSYNQATARLGMDLGLDKVLNTIRLLGVRRQLPNYPSVMLGAGGLAPIEVADMYQTIAAGGFDAPLRAIRNVTNSQGDPLNRYPLRLEQRFNAATIHLLYYALQETMREGTGRSVYNYVSSDLNVAGKTGTTDDLRDSWFAGFTGDRLAVVWLGNDDNTPTGLTGSRGALSVWGGLMSRIKPVSLTGSVPSDIRYIWVDEVTGTLSAENCQGARYMPFIKGSEPTKKSDCVATKRRVGDWIKSWFE